MKTLKITTDNKISIVDVDFKDFRSIQQAVGGYFETVKTRKMWDYFKAPVIMLVDEEGLIKGLEELIRKKAYEAASTYLLPTGWLSRKVGCCCVNECNDNCL